MDASGCVYTTGYFYGTVDFDPNLNVFPLTSFGGPDIYVHKMCPCSLVSVEEESAAGEYALSQAYPNPFTFSTTIEYYLPEPTFVRLSVFDLLGREIAVLVDERKPAGNHSTTFEAAILPTGTYFYGMRAGDFRAIKKMVIMK